MPPKKYSAHLLRSMIIGELMLQRLPSIVRLGIDKRVCAEYNVYMSKIQYTIRNIPPAVDMVIRKRSRQLGKSFNQTVVDLLSLQTFGTTKPPVDDDFSWLYGKKTLDYSFDEAIGNLSQVDEKLWQ